MFCNWNSLSPTWRRARAHTHSHLSDCRRARCCRAPSIPSHSLTIQMNVYHMTRAGDRSLMNSIDSNGNAFRRTNFYKLIDCTFLSATQFSRGFLHRPRAGRGIKSSFRFSDCGNKTGATRSIRYIDWNSWIPESIDWTFFCQCSCCVLMRWLGVHASMVMSSSSDEANVQEHFDPALDCFPQHVHHSLAGNFSFQLCTTHFFFLHFRGPGVSFHMAAGMKFSTFFIDASLPVPGQTHFHTHWSASSERSSRKRPIAFFKTLTAERNEEFCASYCWPSKLRSSFIGIRPAVGLSEWILE